MKSESPLQSECLRFRSRTPCHALATVQLALLVLAVLNLGALAQTISPAFRGPYFLRNVGEVNQFDSHGGAVFKPGDPSKLWVGGNANTPDAKIYELDVLRDGNKHVTGFGSGATIIAPADGKPGEGGIDGGLILGPANVIFYATYPDAIVGQIKAGQSIVSKKIDLATLGVEGSTGGLAIVPPGVAGAGRFKILAYSTGYWYDASLAPDGSNTFNIVPSGIRVDLDVGLEGAFYVPAGSALFPKPSVLIANYVSQKINAYQTDGNGDPIPSTAAEFITDLRGVDGSCVDPLTGDYLFTSFQNNTVFIVGGFGGVPSQVAITSPANGATFGAPATFDIVASAVQTNGAITLVDIYNGTNHLASRLAPPFATALDSVPPGVYRLTAVARDGSGNSTTSAVVTVTVTNIPPVVTINSPGLASRSDVCTPVTFSAAASDTNDSVVKVQFFLGTNIVGEATTPPYTLVSLLTPGTNIFFARAIDTFGGIGNSATGIVSIFIPPTNSFAGPHIVSNIFHACFQGATGVNYVLERTQTLNANTQWQPVVTNTGSPGLIEFIDPSPALPAATRFYRVRKQ